MKLKFINEAKTPTIYDDPKALGQGYAAPVVSTHYFDEANEVIKGLLHHPDKRAAEYAKNSLRDTLDYIDETVKNFENFNKYWNTKYDYCKKFLQQERNKIEKALEDTKERR